MATWWTRSVTTAGLGLQAGARYHLTTYGIWGFALICSPTLRSAIDVGLRYIDLTFAFTRIEMHDSDGEMRFVLDAADVPSRLRRFVIESEFAGIQLIMGSSLPHRLRFWGRASRSRRPTVSNRTSNCSESHRSSMRSRMFSCATGLAWMTRFRRQTTTPRRSHRRSA